MFTENIYTIDLSMADENLFKLKLYKWMKKHSEIRKSKIYNESHP